MQAVPARGPRTHAAAPTPAAANDEAGHWFEQPDIHQVAAQSAPPDFRYLQQLLTADRDTAVSLINIILAEQQAVPRLVRHDQFDWHIHAISDDRPMHERVLVETAMAMIDFVRSGEMSRLRLCAARDCDDIVLDLSRNRSRRFCSTTCGNREAQAAFRARRSR